MHWLEGFPLWECLTGFTDFESDRSPFFDWMYSVRQVVALYRIDRQAWREQSIRYLHDRRPFYTDETTSNIFSDFSDAELVEAVINWICNAIEYNLGYDGNFKTVDRDGKEWDKDAFKVFRYKDKNRKIVYEREYIITFKVGQYCNKVNRLLRARLQDEYQEWERLPDKMGIPEGAVL
jgi:hypothetical protein